MNASVNPFNTPSFTPPLPLYASIHPLLYSSVIHPSVHHPFICPFINNSSVYPSTIHQPFIHPPCTPLSIHPSSFTIPSIHSSPMNPPSFNLHPSIHQFPHPLPLYSSLPPSVQQSIHSSPLHPSSVNPLPLCASTRPPARPREDVWAARPTAFTM